ncbi:MAG: putative amidase domain protein [Firmicutes bacterium ADurb.Bin182]|nr:MAG: putative amidase domain protein [Firmicutes bacterium ADurb.Bin182]
MSLKEFVKKRLIFGLFLFSFVAASAFLASDPDAEPASSISGLSDEELEFFVEKICDIRNDAILKGDSDSIKELYDTGKRNGLWAYEHEAKKMKYLANWSEKQGVEFTAADSEAVIKWSRQEGASYIINMLVSTTYNYIYKDRPDEINTMRIGTYHEMVITNYDQNWLITREWYTDPFADSLDLDSLKTDEIEKIIMSQERRDFSSMHQSRRKAVEYADQYAGAADSGENGYKYNPKYKNYNSVGGDCANFVSQVLFEAGGFKKTDTWNYAKDGSRAWLKSESLKNFMLYSGRASLIVYGNYGKVLALSYKLLPGDIVAYESKGKVKHVSLVTGCDSRGYALVNCHNTDRYRVPWDLGWSNKSVRFYFLRVNY